MTRICPICTGSRRRTEIAISPMVGYEGYRFSPCPACVRGTYEEGAAVAFGLMGMAFAIRRRLGWTECLVTMREAEPISFPAEWHEPAAGFER